MLGRFIAGIVPEFALASAFFLVAAVVVTVRGEAIHGERGTLGEALTAADFRNSTDFRRAARQGAWTGHTTLVLPGQVQANLVILPAAYAAEFTLYCLRNPQPCPLLAVSDPGSPALPEMGDDIDLRSDLPRYRVWRDGELEGEVTDVGDLWRDDLVGFAIGCGLSQDQALIEAGLSVRHVERNENGPMYVTELPTRPAGRFSGNLVVAMRPFLPEQAIRAIQITTRFPGVHGAPVHFGAPEAIGIRDLSRPDFGNATPTLHPGEVPVFWACGVTPQVALRRARPPIAITHSPGYMLVTDRRNAELALL